MFNFFLAIINEQVIIAKVNNENKGVNSGTVGLGEGAGESGGVLESIGVGEVVGEALGFGVEEVVGVGVSEERGVVDGEGDAVAVGVGVGMAVGVGFGVGEGDGDGLGVGLGVGVGVEMKFPMLIVTFPASKAIRLSMYDAENPESSC